MVILDITKKAWELQNIVYNARRGTLGENHPDTLSALYNTYPFYCSQFLNEYISWQG